MSKYNLNLVFQYKIVPLTTRPNDVPYPDPTKEGFERGQGNLVDLERPIPELLLAVVAEFGNAYPFKLTLDYGDMRYIVWRESKQ
jgi:hypothetical protein